MLVCTALSRTSLQSAVSTAYAGMRAISFEGMQYRYDIAYRALAKDGGRKKLRIGVLGSTRGTDLGALLAAMAKGRLPGCEIACVVSNKAKAGILDKAREAGLPALALKCEKGTERKVYDESVTRALHENGVDVVLMIGYMRIVSKSFTDAWSGRMMNVHP